jgi:nucleoid-associated protein YgaU/chemotaxis signal transduction protein
MRSAALLAGEMVPVLELEEILSAGAGGEGGRAEPRYRPGSAFPDLFGREDSDVVEFSLLGATHALPKCEVAETLAWKPSHRVPLAPPIAAGALEQGDAILPVIDLAAAFGMVSSPSPRWRMLLVGNGDFHALVLSEAVLEERRLEKEAQQDLPIELPFPVVYGCYTHGNSVRLILNVEELAVHFDPSLARHLHPAFSFGLGAAPAAAEEERAEAPARPPEAAASGSSAGQAATQVEEQAPAEIEPAEIAPAEATEAAPPFAAPPEEAAEQPAGAGDVVPAEVAFEAAASEEGSRPEEAAGAHPLPAAAEARPLAEAAAGYPDEVAVEISFDAGPPRPEAKAPSLTASVETLPGASLAEALPSAKLPEASAYQGQPAGGLPSAEPPLEEPGWITVSLSGGADEELDLPPREEAVVEPLAREPLEAAAGLPAIEEPQEAVVGLPAIEEPEELVIGAPVVEELRVPGLLPAQAAEEALPVALPGAVSQAEPVPALSRPRERVQGAAGGKSGRNKIAVAAGAVLFAGVVFAVLFAVGIIPWHAATKGSAPAPAAPAPAAAAPAVATPPATTAGKPELELSLPAGSTIEASEYIVQKGDTLWSIARRFTGNPFNYPRIAGENRIADPDLIFPGQRIRLTREKAPPAGGDR